MHDAHIRTYMSERRRMCVCVERTHAHQRQTNSSYNKNNSTCLKQYVALHKQQSSGCSQQFTRQTMDWSEDSKPGYVRRGFICVVTYGRWEGEHTWCHGMWEHAQHRELHSESWHRLDACSTARTNNK